MSTTVTRSIIVDDIDSSIQYTGPWFQDQGSEDSVGSYGPAYQSTLHGAHANASLSFSFSGTQIKVLGSNIPSNNSVVADPTWQCFIDNVSIGTANTSAFIGNNAVFCQQSTLTDGPHILTINATVLENQTFWFDDIQYTPSANVPLNQAAIIINNLDPQLQYGQGWWDLGGIGNMTLVNGSIFTFDFIGVSLSWYGFIPQQLPLSPSSATYSIDGQTPVNFILKGLPANTSTVFNQKFFETAQYPAGPHTLKVVYQGNNSTPLVLNYLIIQNGTSSPTTTSAVGNGVSSTSTHEQSIQGKSSTPTGAVVGGVIGGLALVVFAILGFLLLRRRQKRATQEEIFISTPKPFDYPLHPSSTSPNPLPSSDVSYFQSPQTAQSGSPVTYTAGGHTYHAPIINTQLSQFIEQSSASPGVTYPTKPRSIALQDTSLIVANPLSHSVPTLPLPLPSEVEREAEALTTPRTQKRVNPPSVPAQNNDSWLSGGVLHTDSGIRMPSSTANGGAADVPPLYTLD